MSDNGDNNSANGGASSGAGNAGAGSNPIFQDSARGTFAEHPIQITLPAAVAPTTEGEKNTLRDPLIVVGCSILTDYYYLFDSSFIGPDVKEHIGVFATLQAKFNTSPMSIFGHTDPVGSDAYNYNLGGCRAASFYAMLTRNPDIWDDIYTRSGQYTQVALGDIWGDKVIQTMLTVVTDPSGTPYYSGPCDGSSNADYTDALQRWRSDNGVSPGSASRKKLYSRYFDTVCVDENGKPFQLQKTNFLAQGAGTMGQGDYQGCSRFNPQLVFSIAEDAAYQAATDHTARNLDNQINRRVVTLFFLEGTKIDPNKWPCPNVNTSGGYNQCYKRFWAKTVTPSGKVYQEGGVTQAHNGQQRRFPQALRRNFTCTGNTFACRFYHGLVVHSPCENKRQWNLRLLLLPPKVGFPDKPHADERYVVLVGDSDAAPQIRASTDKDGKLAIPSAYDSESGGMTVTLKTHWNWIDESYYKPKTHDPIPADNVSDESQYLTLTLNAGSLQQMDNTALAPVIERLSNLYYGPLTTHTGPDGGQKIGPDDLNSAEGYFKKHQQLTPDTPDAQMRQRLKDVYGS